MRKRKRILYILLIIIVVGILSLGISKIVNNENKLSSSERTWINENINNVQNISVIKEENGFSRNGSGVFYSFLDDFSSEYGIEINVVSIEDPNDNTYNAFTYTNALTENSRVLYTDHYVVVAKEQKSLKSLSDLDGKVIGILNSDLEYVGSYLKDVTISFNGYDDLEELINAASSSADYIILPRLKYIDEIISKDLEIVYHLSDINLYYTFESCNDTLSKIILKYLNKWEDNIESVLKEEEFSIFTNALNISSAEVDKLLSVDYNYGFVNNSPYEIIMNGTYGGIVAEYLKEFSAFSGVYFDITKYKSVDKLVKALNKGKVDLYFDYNTNISSDYLETGYGINTSLSIITNKENPAVYNSVYSLQGETVYVLNNSALYDYLNSIGNIELMTYENNKELFKLNKENVIIVMDSYIFNYYSGNKLNNYISRYDGVINDEYTFKVSSDYEILYELLNKYISYLDSITIIDKGLNSHENIVGRGNILNTIAIYIICGIAIILVICFIFYKKGKKIRLRKRIGKNDRIRFIDELTCLKNRSYLSDFLKTWSNNTIYPQAIIVIDLNDLQEINDKFGLEEGDKQIKAAANALIKTQLDNSELMRSDGTEFVVYTVGYSQKQIINYIHKLNKEFKKLPYDFGVEFGYSMILDDLKTVEDALAEAIQDVKNKKVGRKK